jgi:serine O-acetyltransferase
MRLVQEDLKAHDGDWTRPGFQALLVYRFGVWRMTIRTKLCRAPFSVLWRALFVAVRNFYGIELPFTARIGRRVIFEHQHGIVVHGHSEIGDDCIIRQGVTLGIRRLDRLNEAPVLGRGVNVGAGAKLLGHIVVGDHAEIGANAVVLDDVPAHALAIGVPARVITRQKGLPRPEGAARHEGRGPLRERTRNVIGISARSSGPASTRMKNLMSKPADAEAPASRSAAGNGAPPSAITNGSGAASQRFKNV